jgi:putative oxidoreductase
MHTLLGRFGDHTREMLRIVAGAMYSLHGFDKTFGLFGHKVPLFSLLGLAGLIELVAGLLIAVGLFSSWVAFLASGEMAVAYFIAHWSQGFWPNVNHGELAVLYCFVFLFFATRGPGRWSLGRLRGSTWRK